MDEPLDLDSACGEHFVFRDLIECGETWRRLEADGARVANVPLSPATVEAIRVLCAVVLDPVARQFGRPALTYGFAGAALTKHIRGRISPPLDQHAGCEVGRTGRAVCPRRGMAADFRVEGLSSRDLMAWIAAKTGFDRLYFYGDDRPLHVSAGPDESRMVVHMIAGPSGRLVPRRG